MSIRSKAQIEIVAEILAIFLYIWILERNAQDWLRVSFFWISCVGFPIYCIFKEQKEFPEFSLDWDDLTRSFRSILWFTLAATACLIGIAFLFNGFNYDGNILLRLCEYFFWSFLQQIGLQIFLTRRLQKILSRPLYISLLSASIFSLIHFPNPALMILAWTGGLFWTYSFQKTPNLYALSLSHGWLAVVSLYSIPSFWLHSLRVGPSYWNY